MTTAQTDLHLDDLANRHQLAVELRRIREESGVKQADLGKRLGLTKEAVWAMENRRQWQIAVVQRWARALNHTLILAVEGLILPVDDGDVLAAIYREQHPTTPEAQDLLGRRQLVNDLARIRRSLVSKKEMGVRLGRSEYAVREFETNPDGMLLVSAQRFTRALGGHLVVSPTPIVPVTVDADTTVLPCGTDSARQRHAAHGETCPVCDSTDRPVHVLCHQCGSKDRPTVVGYINHLERQIRLLEADNSRLRLAEDEAARLRRHFAVVDDVFAALLRVPVVHHEAVERAHRAITEIHPTAVSEGVAA